MIKLMIFLLCATSLSGCTTYAPAEQSNEISHTRISAEQAYVIMAESNDFVLLDVRTHAEFQAEQIGGAILIPYDEIAARAADELPDKNAVILIYCRTGRRSDIAAQALAKLGYTSIYDFGGIVDWSFGTEVGHD